MTVEISLACFFTWAYVSRSKGPDWPGRWQFEQWVKTIGAISLQKVSVPAGRGTYRFEEARDLVFKKKPATSATPTTKRASAVRVPRPNLLADLAFGLACLPGVFFLGPSCLSCLVITNQLGILP